MQDIFGKFGLPTAKGPRSPSGTFVRKCHLWNMIFWRQFITAQASSQLITYYGRLHSFPWQGWI